MCDKKKNTDELNKDQSELPFIGSEPVFGINQISSRQAVNRQISTSHQIVGNR